MSKFRIPFNVTYEGKTYSGDVCAYGDLSAYQTFEVVFDASNDWKIMDAVTIPAENRYLWYTVDERLLPVIAEIGKQVESYYFRNKYAIQAQNRSLASSLHYLS